MIDLDALNKEYGEANDPCPFCGGMNPSPYGFLGHLILTRPDGGHTRCQVGDVRDLVKYIREMHVQWNESLDAIAKSIPTHCPHGWDIHGTCDVCDKTDPLNCALEEAMHYLEKISRGYPPLREEALELLERIQKFRNGEITG